MSTTTQIDLTPFYAKEAGRYTADRPWVKNGKRYATDGIVAIRIDATGEPDSVEGTFPDAESVLKRFARPVSVIGGHPFSFITRNNVCEECDRKGTVGGERKCDECNGTGEVECYECGHVQCCEECDGKGTINDGPLMPCEDCDGRGKWTENDVDFGGDWVIAGEYWKHIAALPGVRIGLPTKPQDVMWFEFDGGCGAVMARKK